jgi:hypothetical protein
LGLIGLAPADGLLAAGIPLFGESLVEGESLSPSLTAVGSLGGNVLGY